MRCSFSFKLLELRALSIVQLIDFQMITIPYLTLFSNILSINVAEGGLECGGIGNDFQWVSVD